MQNRILAVVTAAILAACSGGPPKQADAPEAMPASSAADMKPAADASAKKDEPAPAPKPEMTAAPAASSAAPVASAAAPAASSSGKTAGKAPAAPKKK